MKYNIGKIGREFLKAMKIKHNFEDYKGPKIQSLAELVEDSLPNDETSFRFSVHNPYHHPRMAKEIMEKLFTSEKKSELQRLMEKLETEEASLINSASSEVKSTMDECRNGPGGIIERMENAIVCEVFGHIPPAALNLLGLMKIQPTYFSQSYHFFGQMLEDFNENGRTYGQAEIKEHFSKAVEGLKNLVESIKKRKNPQKEANEKNKEQPEEEKDTPTNSNENPPKPTDSENNENPNETNEPTSTNPTDSLLSLREQVIQLITEALNQNPKLDNRDLSSEYQDWPNQLNHLEEENEIIFLKDGLLKNIQRQRKEKIKKQTTGEVNEIINDNLQKAQNPDTTIQEKKEVLADNEKYEGQLAYEDKNTKEKIKNLKKEVAQDNPTEYRNKIISDLDIKLKNNRLTKEELDDKTQALIKALEEQKISDPSQLVETEVEITQKISQKGAAKKITNFRRKVRKVLKSNNKTKIDELKKQLTEFIKSNNIYYQTQKSKAQQLLKKLESGLVNNSRSSLPFSAQIGIGMGATLVVLFFAVLIWKKKKSR